MSKLELPIGWATCELQYLGNIVTGKTPSTKDPDNFDGPIPFVKPGDLDNGAYILSTADKLTEKGLKLVPSLPANSLAVTCIGNLGKVGITTQISATNQQINSVIPHELVNYKFLYHQLRTLKPWLESEASATTVAIINKGKFSKAPIKLPPLAEQKVIADKLDTLLAQVESIKARLERISEILKQFRQSVLAAAVSGKLTKDLERGVWKELKLEAVASNIVDCPHSTPKWSESGKYCVRTTGFNPFYLDLSQQGFVSDEVYQERIQRLEPKPNDILYSREGTVGIACQIPDGVELCLGQRMVLIRAGESCNSKYLTMVLNSDHILSIVKSMTIGSTAPRVNMKDIRNYPIPIPAMDEQNQIVLRVERLFRSIEVIGEQVQSTLDRVNNLTQSILAKAFRGELTAEWREANPELISGENSAEALLKRIKAERESAKPTTKRGRAET
ncbi:restriction endonuclease subunit S [Acinetobacter nosocomialis]|uniref:restriction endonuclease subunit S n=1 Tax=Acinetobacter nosocomialis TaxID=106654 RepID=UPI001B81FA6A|nr:restriction endonuclease subunit S [Acinetobacter nosocomialis]MBR7717999.1 restriction endonuclease subunit S [Acinetobacter nosocomialis]